MNDVKESVFEWDHDFVFLNDFHDKNILSFTSILSIDRIIRKSKQTLHFRMDCVPIVHRIMNKKQIVNFSSAKSNAQQ